MKIEALEIRRSNMNEILRQSPILTHTARPLFLCSHESQVCTYTQHVVRVWSVLGDFLKARIDKVSKVIRPGTQTIHRESK